jgi:hypothetical protein
MSTDIGKPEPGERDTSPEIRARAAFMLVRDVVRGQLHRLSPHERTLRVPYDLFLPEGPVVLRDGKISYMQGGQPVTGSVAECELVDTHPGERVILRLQDATSDADEWWLCQVENGPVAP